MADDTPTGTFACPICGYDKPHHHPEEQVEAYRADAVRDDGWTTTQARNPKESGWYLCSGIEVDLEQFGEPSGFYDHHPKWSQLHWLKWVRQAGNAGLYNERDIPEVLYFDKRQDHFGGWRLRNFLGNAVASGAESRFPVHAQPKFWRPIPENPNG